MNKIKNSLALLLPLILLLAACSADVLPPEGEGTATEVPIEEPTKLPQEEVPTPEATSVEEPVGSDILVGKAYINSVSLNLMESFPLQASVTVQGDLADGCTSLGEVIQTRDGNTIFLTVQTTRPAEQMCDMALKPFAENFTVDILGLPAGDYTIDVNGATTQLTLTQDNS